MRVIDIITLLQTFLKQFWNKELHNNLSKLIGESQLKKIKEYKNLANTEHEKIPTSEFQSKRKIK